MAAIVRESSGGDPEEEEEERQCRYCFEGTEEGELISPCACKGGQKWVHLACLRRWQRMVLVSQPTHPMYYRDDERHHICGVCKSKFTCPPPTRHELMESFTGSEIGALISVGCTLASHGVFSEELKKQIASMPFFHPARENYAHWIDCVYLITGVVEEGDGELEIPVSNARMLTAFRNHLLPSLRMTTQGRELRLLSRGALEGSETEDELRRRFEALGEGDVPCTFVLKPTTPPTSGDDHITAVNLTRSIAAPRDPGVVDAARAKVPEAAHVELTHFNGGPCDEEEIVTCLVVGGRRGPGWVVVPELADALRMAHQNAACNRTDPAQGAVSGGQTVRLVGLQAAVELNGFTGVAMRFSRKTGRWLVRLANGEGKRVKPTNLEGLDGANGRVFAFWGDARWSRTQLLGETARGHWGLCRSLVAEILAPVAERRKAMDGRLVFAMETEMTEEFMRNAQERMEALRDEARLVAAEAETNAEGDDGDDGGDTNDAQEDENGSATQGMET